MLSAKRIARRICCPAASSARCRSRSIRSARSIYVPRLFSTYATRYGVIGAVFAMISALFCVAVVLVASAAVGREVDDELDRIKRGETAAPDEVRRQWEEVTASAARPIGRAGECDRTGRDGEMWLGHPLAFLAE